jgi:hypothetical protein
MMLFKEKNPLSYLDLVQEFEAVKRTVRTENKTKVNLTIPFVAIDGKCKGFFSLNSDITFSPAIS